MGELLDGFGERGVGGVGGRGEDVRGEEVQAEGEVGGGEDGEGFDEDVGDGFVAREVRVELVSGRVEVWVLAVRREKGKRGDRRGGGEEREIR